MSVYLPGRHAKYSDYVPCVEVTEIAAQEATPTESYGNFGLEVRKPFRNLSNQLRH
jgi:hypothetical protein